MLGLLGGRSDNNDCVIVGAGAHVGGASVWKPSYRLE